MPSEQLLADMGAYNEELVKAGIMQAGEGLHPSSKGKRIHFKGGEKKVVDGPFPQTEELIAGFWLWQVDSMEEAIAWAKRCPATDDEVIEVRQVQEMSDFPQDVQDAAAGFDEMQHAARR